MPQEIYHARIKLWIRLLKTVSKAETVLKRRMAKETDLTLSQFDALMALDRTPKNIITMSGLSNALLITNASTSGLVSRMEKLGWVNRLPLPSDKRVYSVSLTTKGRKVLRSTIDKHNQWVNELLHAVDQEDIANITPYLDRIRQQIPD